MIVFNLSCNNEHRFRGWFVSAADYDRQQQAALLNCPVCGSKDVNKGLHAPYVNTGTAVQVTEQPRKAEKPPAQYVNMSEEITKLIEHVIANTEDVGTAFPEEARKIHYKEAPERKIRGSASSDEVHELRDEGIEVVALPVPRHLVDKTH